MKRKWLVRSAVILGVLMSTVLVVVPAMAIWDWCDVDPVVSIGGHTVNLDASIQGDPGQITGNIEFTVTVPLGTEVNVISSQPGATVDIQYMKWFPAGFFTRFVPVYVNVDINTKAVYNTRLVVTVDGQKVASDAGNTRGELNCIFILR